MYFGNYYGLGYPGLQYGSYNNLTNPMLQVSNHSSNSSAFTSRYVDNNDTPFKVTLGVLGVGTLLAAAIAFLSKGKAEGSLGKISSSVKTFEQEAKAAGKLAEQGEKTVEKAAATVENAAGQGTKRRRFGIFDALSFDDGGKVNNAAKSKPKTKNKNLHNTNGKKAKIVHSKVNDLSMPHSKGFNTTLEVDGDAVTYKGKAASTTGKAKKTSAAPRKPRFSDLAKKQDGQWPEAAENIDQQWSKAVAEQNRNREWENGKTMLDSEVDAVLSPSTTKPYIDGTELSQNAIAENEIPIDIGAVKSSPNTNIAEKNAIIDKKLSEDFAEVSGEDPGYLPKDALSGKNIGETPLGNDKFRQVKEFTEKGKNVKVEHFNNGFCEKDVIYRDGKLEKIIYYKDHKKYLADEFYPNGQRSGRLDYKSNGKVKKRNWWPLN